MGRGYNDGKYDFNPNPNNVTLTCPICGTEFEPRTRNQKYCYETCRRKADRNMKKARSKANG